jgi:hypothetical protein
MSGNANCGNEARQRSHGPTGGKQMKHATHSNQRNPVCETGGGSTAVVSLVNKEELVGGRRQPVQWEHVCATGSSSYG